MTLTEDQLRRLARLLGMMGSHHDGEILNAAKAAQKFLVASLGSTAWEEVLLHNNGARWTDDDVRAAIDAAYKQGYAAREADAKDEAIKALADADTCPAFAALCLAKHKHLLTAWEIEFCESWATKSEHLMPTDKQIAVFQRLARKVKLTPP
jgi:hypothetical protein